jgi:hypothetical protein
LLVVFCFGVAWVVVYGENGLTRVVSDGQQQAADVLRSYDYVSHE